MGVVRQSGLVQATVVLYLDEGDMGPYWDCCFDPPAQDSRSLEATKDSFAADGDALCLDVGGGLVQ